eukprot:6205245-Pleurochrysis_carterae.AAC.1
MLASRAWERSRPTVSFCHETTHNSGSKTRIRSSESNGTPHTQIAKSMLVILEREENSPSDVAPQ